MQARLSLIRFPSFVFGVVFALIASLILGVAVGYALKPAAQLPGTTHVIYLPQTSPDPIDNGCVFVGKQKEC